MSRKLIKPVTIRDFKGILVDTVNWKGRKIYRVFEPFNESTKRIMFYHTIHENGEYIDVDDWVGEEDGKIETSFKSRDSDPKLYDIPEKMADKIRREQIVNFLWLSGKAKERIPIRKIIKLIKEVPIKCYNSSEGTTEYFSMMGYYDTDEHLVAFDRNQITSNSPYARSARFHECIHYIQDMLSNGKEEITDDVFLEAQVENLSIERCLPNMARAVTYKETAKPMLAVYNCPVDCYKYALCILRQMEAIMGRKSYDKDFASTKEFPHEFIKKYGKELYTYIFVRANSLEYEISEDLNKNRGSYLSETQDKLMKEAFRQDVSRMKTIEDAKDILTRLRELEKQRIIIYIKDDEKISELGDYVGYYNKTYKTIGQKLLSLGYSREEIITELEPLKYEEQQFYPICPVEMFVKNLRKNVESDLLKCYERKQGKVFDPDKQKIVYSVYANGDNLIGIADRKAGKLCMLRGHTDTITNFVTDRKESVFTKEDVMALESPDVSELELPEKLYKKYKRLSKKNIYERDIR